MFSVRNKTLLFGKSLNLVNSKLGTIYERMTKYCHIFPGVNLPLTDHKLALGVPPPDVVDNCKLDQS